MTINAQPFLIGGGRIRRRCDVLRPCSLDSGTLLLGLNPLYPKPINSMLDLWAGCGIQTPLMHTQEVIMQDKAALGTRYSCYECEKKFYDLNRPEPICPGCGANQHEDPTPDPRVAVMARYKGSRLTTDQTMPSKEQFKVDDDETSKADKADETDEADEADEADAEEASDKGAEAPAEEAPAKKAAKKAPAKKAPAKKAAKKAPAKKT
jgi:uncharacterized protein (TIGR02300 family)